jgi:hypothetical protein
MCMASPSMPKGLSLVLSQDALYNYVFMMVFKWDIYFYTNTYAQFNHHREGVAPLPMQITLGLENHNTYAYNFILFCPCSNHNKTQFMYFFVIVNIQKKWSVGALVHWAPWLLVLV